MKSFKYFDLNSNGTVEPEEFAKAIEKIGIMIPTRQVRCLFLFHKFILVLVSVAMNQAGATPKDTAFRYLILFYRI